MRDNLSTAFTLDVSSGAVLGKYTGDVRASELAALIRIEDLWLSVPREGVLQRLDAERRFQRD